MKPVQNERGAQTDFVTSADVQCVYLECHCTHPYDNLVLAIHQYCLSIVFTAAILPRLVGIRGKNNRSLS